MNSFFPALVPAQSYSAMFHGIAFFGRTLEEYAAFFDLNITRDLTDRRVFDCSAGPSSFAAQARALDANVVAGDPLYGRTSSALGALATCDIATVLRAARLHPENFQFTFYRDFEHLEHCRRTALQLFLRDYGGGFANGRYVRAELPRLPFADQSFALALNSHFLFLYAARLGEDFLGASLRELARVAREVRIYPLVDLEGRDYSANLDYLQNLAGAEIDLEVRHVPFGFFKNSKAMLRLYRSP